MKVYTTELDTCPVGCGDPLVFLYSPRRRKVFLSCPSCGSVFDTNVISSEDPTFYNNFAECELRLPSVALLKTQWDRAVLEPDEDSSRFYLEYLRRNLGYRLYAEE
jgi:hypothetical protein